MVIDTVVKRALGEQPAASHYPNGGFRHRVSAATEWRNGQESVKTALKEIQDVLYSLPGYREAEQSGNREEQLRILGQVLQQAGRQRDYFVETGLSGLMRGLIDPPGRTGPKKLVSVSALLDFYSEGKRLDWFSPAYAAHLAAGKRGRLAVVNRNQEWANWQYGSKRAYEGTGLEAIVDDALAKYGLQNGVADFCYMFFSPQDALLANSRKERAVLAYKLGIFLYMAGVIPRVLPDGKVRRLGPQIQDLAFMGYSYFANVKKRTSLESVVVDKPFSRLMMAIVKRATDPLRGGPSVRELIDEVGSHPLIAQRYGRVVSYDDVLPVWEVMQRYQTGQRAVTIRIGSRSVQMSPETLDDFWVLNPGFIRLKQDMLLFYFWKRVGKGQWKDLVNQTLQRKRMMEYLGTTGATVTYEAIKSNPKAKYIKRGALPSRELVRLGVLAMPERRKASAPDGQGGVPKDRYRSPAGPTPPPPVISYDEFRGYVPRAQLAATAFVATVNELLRERPVSGHELVNMANAVGVRHPRGTTIEAVVRKLVKEMPRVIEVIGLKPGNIASAADIENAPVYYGLEGSEPIRQVFSDALKKAVHEIRQDYVQRAVNQAVGGLINVLEESGVRNKGDLEELLQKGWPAIQAVKGLVNQEPSKRDRLAYFLRACQIIGYDVPPEAVEASLLKYFGKDSPPVKDAFRPYVKQAVMEINPQFNERAVNQATGALIYGVLESNGIVFMSNLEGLLRRGKEAISGLNGLVSKDPKRQHAMKDYFVRACELAGYKVGNGAAAAP